MKQVEAQQTPCDLRSQPLPIKQVHLNPHLRLPTRPQMLARPMTSLHVGITAHAHRSLSNGHAAWFKASATPRYTTIYATPLIHHRRSDFQRDHQRKGIRSRLFTATTANHNNSTKIQFHQFSTSHQAKLDPRTTPQPPDHPPPHKIGGRLFWKPANGGP